MSARGDAAEGVWERAPREMRTARMWVGATRATRFGAARTLSPALPMIEAHVETLCAIAARVIAPFVVERSDVARGTELA